MSFQSTQEYGLYGDGSDGDVTISGGTTTLSRNMNYRSLTIAADGILAAAGFRVNVQTVLTNNGLIHRNGNAGSNGTISAGGLPGSALPAAFYGGGGSGGSGGTAAGSNGGSVTVSLGGSAGNGGAGSGGAGGSGGTVTAPAAINGGTKVIKAYPCNVDGQIVGSMLRFGGGAGGGGGGGDSVAGGGGGGGSGGVLIISARRILGTNGIFSSDGGAGGNGYSLGNCGGGGGGGGGLVILLSDNDTLVDAPSITVRANGGNGGLKSGTGSNGSSGSSGTVLRMVLA